MASLLSYCDYDFDDLKQALIARLQATDAWKDTYESSTGQMIIEFYAYIANLTLYLLERRAEECYIATAQNKSSVINLVKLLNYSVRRAVSSTGTLQFSITTADQNIIYIPMYTQCQSANGVNFLTSRDVSIIPPSLSVTVGGIQGTLINQQFTSDGTANQQFTITDTTVENTNYKVLVDGEAWNEVSTFIESTSTSTDFQLISNLDDTLTLIFGDNTYGAIPAIGLTIDFQYVSSSGLSGNVYQTGLITTVSSNIYDNEGNQVTATVTNSTSFTGGDDIETIDDIRTNAPAVFSTGDRAVTKGDFIAILKNYPSVADANAWGEAEESPPNYNMFNTVRMCIILENWEIPTNSFKTTLGTYLNSLSMLTVKYEFIDPTILEVIPTVDIYVVPGYSLSQAQVDVEVALGARFALGETTKLGTPQEYSNLVSVVNDLVDVDHLHMILEIRKDMTVGGGESGFSYGEILDAVPIKKESVKVYATVGGESDDLIGIDNGNGSFTDVESGCEVTGTVDYTNGIINLDFSPSVSGVYVRYQQDEEGDIIPTKDQICELFEVDVTNITYAS